MNLPKRLQRNVFCSMHDNSSQNLLKFVKRGVSPGNAEGGFFFKEFFTNFLMHSEAKKTRYLQEKINCFCSKMKNIT